VFTGGIGENAAQIREKICVRTEWLGAKIGLEENIKNASVINNAVSKLSINIIPTDEELMIAQHVFRLS